MTIRWVALSALVSLIALSTIADGSNVQTPDFVTTAKVDQASLNTKIYKQTWRFFAEVTVKNTSTTPKTISVWLNQAWPWVTDSEDVWTSQEAEQNYPRSITLQPGEVRKEYLEMWADPKARRPIAFRLGFIPNFRRPVQDAQDPTLIWSNPVTLAR